MCTVVTLYIDIVPNRGSPPAVLLRQGWRQGGKICKRTVANLSGWPSKLACTRSWRNTTLAQELQIQDAQVDELYQALDWLFARQQRIEKKLAHRHLRQGCLALYDVTPGAPGLHSLARRGHNRDGKKNTLSIVYGLLTDSQGRPVSVGISNNVGRPDPWSDPDEELAASLLMLPYYYLAMDSSGNLASIRGKNEKFTGSMDIGVLQNASATVT